jgi:hypothetical protein
MTPLEFHQARLLASSLRRECKNARKHLERIGESGFGDPADAITEHARRIASLSETLTTVIKRGRK